MHKDFVPPVSIEEFAAYLDGNLSEEEMNKITSVINIEDNLQIGLEFSKKLPASSSAMKEVLERVELNKPLTDNCTNLSGGEKQRLCLARVMLMDADTYLLDEPSAALDKETELFIIDNFTKLGI